MGQKGRRKMAPEKGSGHKEQMERDTMVPEAEPETKKPKEKSLRIQEPFYLSLIFCLLQLISKILICREAILDS